MKRLNKYITGFLVVAGIIAISNYMHGHDPEVTRATTVKFEEEITLDSKSMVYQPILLAPYETMDTFISDEKTADFNFTSVGGHWEEVIPEGTNIISYLRFKVDGEWSSWLELEVEEDLIEPDKKYAIASSNPAEGMQYKYEMYGDGINRPLIKNVEWTFIRAVGGAGVEEIPQPKYSSNAAVSNITHLSFNRTNTNTNVTSRNSWGANESYRYSSNDDEEPILVKLSSSYYELYKDELTFSRVVEEDSKGKSYIWPLQYPKKVKKVIIHHTATTKNLNNPKQAIRDIYYYHSVTRGWGDIGYNYLIDKEGKVYEGRYGGNGVIGAHAGGSNNGSIGIAVLGNFEEESVSNKAVTALGKLIAEKTKVHGIDPEGKSRFRGEMSKNVIGHKDVAATQCPGEDLYEKLPLIRSLAVKYKKNDKEKYVIDYDFIDESDLYYIEMKPNETKAVTVKLENIGKKSWDSSTYLIVDQNPAFEGVISFPNKSGTTLVKMSEASVGSGKSGTFKFNIKSTSNAQTVTMNFAVMFNGKLKSSDYVIVPLSVQQTAYTYKLTDSKYPEKTMDKDEKFTAWVKLKNTGNTTWTKSNVKLMADHEKGHKNAFTGSTTVGTLKGSSVKPGKTGTFEMKLVAPSEPGYHKEYFTPVVDGNIWMKDTGMYFEATIYGGKYAAQLISLNSKEEWKQGKSYAVYLKFRNLGKTTWTAKDLEVNLVKESDLEVRDAKLMTNSVKPGEAGVISFIAKVSNTDALGKKAVLVQPKMDGENLLISSVRVPYTVIGSNAVSTSNSSTMTTASVGPAVTKTTPSTTTTSKTSSSTVAAGNGEEEDIRIKLSFDGSPEVSGNGTVGVYSGDSHIADLSKGKTATVTYSASKYKVKIGSKSYSKSNPIRFVPKKSSTILEIENYDHAPGWNASLNDNIYRGKLEVNYDKGLIVINELPLEDYMKGIGEVSNSEEYEKIKAIMVAARTYALYYMEESEKFPGKPYNLDDDPNTSQKYLGYGMEKRSSQVVKAVNATKGQVVTYDGDLVKTPYFSQSDGTKTKSAKAVWGWNNTPHLVAVRDAFCDANSFAGHGVGLSGCGAKGMAENGYNYTQILKYYYSDIEVTDLY